MTSRPFAGRTLRAISLLLPLSLGLGTRLAAQNTYATPYTFSVLAGQGADGSADGTGSDAYFYEPGGLALDSSGNLYVADTANDIIREVSSSGATTTIAGTAGDANTADGTGSVANFKLPFALTVDSSGNIWVADTDNNTIRQITPKGVVSTFSGTAGTAGYSNATGVSSTFNQPNGIAIDSSGNLYVADTNNDVIRMITPKGVASTYAGLADYPGSVDATGTSASFNVPTGLAIDSSGNLYVADTGNNTIRKVASGGVVTTLAGQAGTNGSRDGTGTAALFNSPRGIAVDSAGNIYVADSANGLIRKVTQAGVVTTIAGSPNNYANQSGTGSAALFDVPDGIAVDSSGNIYVSQRNGNVISKGTLTPSTAPSFTTQPVGQTVTSGSTVVFRTAATGQPLPTYQWNFNGTPLQDGGVVTGATGATLVLSGATAANAGSYTCTATSSAGSATSSAAVLSISTTTDIGRLINISTRSSVGTQSDVLIAGFVVGGSGTSGSEPVLIRASGPALAAFNVSGLLPDPELQVVSGTSIIGTDIGWAGNAAIANTAAAVGAFAWTSPTSADSALLENLAVGPYTAEVSGSSGDTGVALAEVYDATPSGSYTPASPRLINISARANVGTAPNVLIAGFVIGGSTSRTVLIRASGPALLGFGVPNTLADPELQLFSGSTVVASNTKWGGDAEISMVANSVGAFPWASLTSADSALLVTLPPGAYTAEVSGATGDSGVALVEVYEVP